MQKWEKPELKKIKFRVNDSALTACKRNDEGGCGVGAGTPGPTDAS